MNLTNAQTTLYAKSEIKPVLLAYLDLLWPNPANANALEPYPVRLWTGYGTITPTGTGDALLDNLAFTGMGDFLGISTVQEVGDVRSVPLQISLSALPVDNVELVLAKYYRHRKGYVWLAAAEQHGSWWTTPPVRLFGGRMDSMDMQEDSSTATITMTLESHLADLRRARATRYTHESQQRLHSGDLTFSRIHAIRNKDVYWGRSNPV